MLQIGHLSVIFLFQFIRLLLQVNCEVCPEKIGHLRRVGQTKFYIDHDPPRGRFADFEEAQKICQTNGLWMARIRDMQTMVIVDWLGAFYDNSTQQYMWTKRGNETRDLPVQYCPFLYRPFRPAGLASFVNFKGEYLIDSGVKQCLTLALPWPGKWDPNRQGVTYGHQTILDERPCISVQTRHVMCEINKTACESKERDPFILNEDKISYFEDGYWILGNRKYIFNWKHRTFNESERHCKSLGLQLVDPGLVEKDLIPYLKMWSRNVTVSQFWTGIRFDAKAKMFVDSTGAEIDRGKQNIRVEWKDSFHLISTRSNKHSPEFCVALSLSYEFRHQISCDDYEDESCTWSFIDYIPVNCNNYLGAICQHPHLADDVEKLRWDPNYIPYNINQALNDTAITKDFGFTNNTRFIRSTYKQTFGSLVCPAGYRMVRESSTDWASKPSVPTGSLYIYDYKSTYWVVDSGGFHKKGESECTISMPDKIDGEGHSRQLVRVKCTSWNFYLCERNRRPTKSKQYKTQPPPTMVWSERRQPRLYPVVN